MKASFLIFVTLIAATLAADKVKLALYYESQCPGCRQFITTQLSGAVDKGLLQIMDVELFPFGNAQETQTGSSYTYTCQHGEEECKGNMFESCAIEKLQDFKTYWPLIHCIEEHDLPEESAKACGAKAGIDTSDIFKCYNSDEGVQAEHKMAVATNNLKPAHQYVPWLTIDGAHNEDETNACLGDLVTCICNKYQGSDAPAACGKQLTTIEKCYKEEQNVFLDLLEFLGW
eukprot:CAMPEP_0115007708 /NCGR_PEP_ID=MMETSP0216-20121206/21392_1 /TAXON_ID=223996 /ORGANISM="Protocruzia adherens, Strain Boccale" /LENGTH=229 /DNA_ID=CAMNT_0002374805 /DNA_START=25 /DNA_END=714 /DNA_ORIENTATION=+